MEINVSILTGIGLIESFKWSNIKIVPIPEHDKIILDSDVSLRHRLIQNEEGRICELEFVKNLWLDLDLVQGKVYNRNFNRLQFYLDKLKKKFEPYFKIKKVFYDDIGILIIKLVLIAEKEGILNSISDSNPNLKENLDLGINLIVKSEDHPVENEVKKNFLFYERSDIYEIRKNEELIFYFSTKY